jgi:hypothetical protein
MYQAWALCRWYGMSFRDLLTASGTLSSGLSLADNYHGYYLKVAVLYQESLRDLFVAIAIAGFAYDHFRCQDLALRTYEVEVQRRV